MSVAAPQNAYHLFSKIIHWVSALIILILLGVGFYMTRLDFSEDKLQIYAMHKSFGILVLILACVRVVGHVFVPRPKPLETHKKYERILSHAVHIMLYVILFAMPLSGWVMSSAGDFSIQFFGLDMPDIVAKDKGVFELSREAHTIMAFVLVMIIGLHIAGAFKHHFIDRDRTLKRMALIPLSFPASFVFAFVVLAFYAPGGFFAADKIVKKVVGSVVGDEEKSKPSDEEEHDVSAISEESDLSIASEVTAWNIDLDKSDVMFVATQYGQGFEGHLKILSAQIFFDKENLGQSEVSVKIDISSMNTGSEDRDSQALSEEWFDTKNFPVAKFEADEFLKISDNQFVAKGVLTIRDVARPLSLPFHLEMSEDGARVKMTSAIALNRLDFGVGQGQWKSVDAIGGDVKLDITVHALKK